MKFGILASWKWNWRPLSKVHNLWNMSWNEFSSTAFKLFSKIYKLYIYKKVTIFIRTSSKNNNDKKSVEVNPRLQHLYPRSNSAKVLDFYNFAASVSTLNYRHFHTRLTDLERDHFEYWHVYKQLPLMTSIQNLSLLKAAFNISGLQI